MGKDEDLELHRVGRHAAAARIATKVSWRAPRSAAAISSAPSAAATTSSRCRRSRRSSTRPPRAALGLFEGQVTVLIHTGSRGLGHQVCTDHVRVMDAAIARLRHRRSRIASSPARRSRRREGQSYFAAMCAAANFAWVNRQVLTHRVRDRLRARPRRRSEIPRSRSSTTSRTTSRSSRSTWAGRLCVHRKGATRAFGPGSARASRRATGRSASRCSSPAAWAPRSFVLVGTAVGSSPSRAAATARAER